MTVGVAPGELAPPHVEPCELACEPFDRENGPWYGVTGELTGIADCGLEARSRALSRLVLLGMAESVMGVTRSATWYVAATSLPLALASVVICSTSSLTT